MGTTGTGTGTGTMGRGTERTASAGLKKPEFCGATVSEVALEVAAIILPDPELLIQNQGDYLCLGLGFAR